jgi:hypothetical protein
MKQRARFSCSRKLDRRHTGRLRKRDNLLTREGAEGDVRGAELYDRKRAWSSINHSLHSGHEGEPNSYWSMLRKVSPPIQYKFLASKRGSGSQSIFYFQKMPEEHNKKALLIYINNDDIRKGCVRKPLYCLWILLTELHAGTVHV